MPLYEEKFINPFAIRFSQERIRPTFQDGRLVDRTLQQIEAVPWSCLEDCPSYNESDYDVYLKAPFPPIEIIRWVPKLRREDGHTCIDEDGSIMLGDACWFTFDNRRLYCLQAAAAKHWPRHGAAIVHIMHGIPGSKSTPRKFRTTDLGYSIRVSRRNDPVPKSIWNWTEATKSVSSSAPCTEADAKIAMDRIGVDEAKGEAEELNEVPADIEERSLKYDALDENHPDIELDWQPREESRNGKHSPRSSSKESKESPPEAARIPTNGGKSAEALLREHVANDHHAAALQNLMWQQQMAAAAFPGAAGFPGLGMPPRHMQYGMGAYNAAAMHAAWYPPYSPWGGMGVDHSHHGSAAATLAAFNAAATRQEMGLAPGSAASAYKAALSAQAKAKSKAASAAAQSQATAAAAAAATAKAASAAAEAPLSKAATASTATTSTPASASTDSSLPHPAADAAEAKAGEEEDDECVQS